MSEPLEVEPAAVEVDRPRFADWCEYRLVGDDCALVWVGVETDVVGSAADARLHVLHDGQTTDVSPLTVTFDPDARTTRFAFLVDRAAAKSADAELSISVPSYGRLELPTPAELPSLDVANIAIETVVAGTVTGTELVATMNLLERRCAIAERVAEDLRSAPTDAQKLAQAYRESWELRALLDSREQAHQHSADAVERAEAEAGERAAEAAAAQAELADLHATLEDTNSRHAVEHAQRDATIERLEAELAAGNEAAATWQAEVSSAREQLAAAVSESEQHEHELGELRETVELLQTELSNMGDEAEAWATEAERARGQLAEAVERAEIIEDERDSARASVFELETAVSMLQAELDSEISAASAELEGAVSAARAEMESAVRAAQAERYTAIGAAQDERDAAVSAAEAERDAAVRAAHAERNEAVRSAHAERESAISAAQTELETARREADSARAVLEDAANRADVLARERDEERAARNRVEQELARSQALATDTEGRLEREQALYEARIASAVESERKLRRRVAELEEKLSEQPRSIPGVSRRKKETIPQQFADAQRARLRETTLAEQREQVAALERQLEQLKQRSSSRDSELANSV